MKETEEHEKQFKGLWIPVQVIEMVEKGTIDATSMLVIAYVEALTSESSGCYASNEWFAKKLQKSVDRIGRIISKLVKLKILVRMNKKNERRVVSVDWAFWGLNRYIRRRPTAFVTVAPLSSLKSYTNNYQQRAVGDAVGSDELQTSKKIRSKTIGEEPSKTPDQTGGLVKAWTTDEMKKETKRHPLDASRARKLLKVRAAFKPGGKVNAEAWTRQMRLLKGDLQDTKRLDEVLDWYCKNYRNKYVPRCSAPIGFRNKFSQIEAAMLREQGFHPRNSRKTKPLKQAKVITKRLKATYTWPKGSSTHLGEMVQRAIDQFNWFFEQLDEIAKNGRGKSRRRTAFVLSERFTANPSSYAEMWFEKVSDTITGWEDWSGKMTMFEFVYYHKTFEKECVEKLRAYGFSDPQERYQKIKELMDESREQREAGKE